jgi:hypothetical protein
MGKSRSKGRADRSRATMADEAHIVLLGGAVAALCLAGIGLLF